MIHIGILFTLGINLKRIFIMTVLKRTIQEQELSPVLKGINFSHLKFIIFLKEELSNFFFYTILEGIIEDPLQKKLMKFLTV